MPQQPTRSFDPTVFSLRARDTQFVESVKLDPIKAFLPIALGAVGLTLLLFTKIAGAEPLNFKGAPFELRLKNFRQSAEIRGRWGSEIQIPQMPGSLEKAAWTAALDRVELSGATWILRGVSAGVSVDGWSYGSSIRSGVGISAACRHLSLSFLPGEVRLKMPEKLDVEIRAVAGQLKFRPKLDLGVWLKEQLKPYFYAADFDQSFRIEADCDGELGELARRLIRARLSDLPRKDPSFFDRVTDQIAAQGKVALDAAIERAALKIPAGLDVEQSVSIQTNAQGEWLLRVADDSADILPSGARAQVRELPASGASAQLLLTPAALSRTVAIGLAAVASAHGGRYENGRIMYTLPQTFQAGQLASIIGELVSRPSGELVQVQVALPNATTGEGNPSLKPWLSGGGGTAGIDLIWTLELQVLDAQGAVLATRSLNSELSFRDDRAADGRFTLKYLGGRWNPERSEVGNAAPELGITLDWLLQSDTFRNFLERSLSRTLDWEELQRVEFRRVGQANLRTRRASGGYYADGLVIDIKLP